MQFTPTQKRAFSWGEITVLISFSHWLLGPVVASYVVAIVLAYVLTQVVDWLDDGGKHRAPRFLAVLGALLASAVLLFTVRPCQTQYQPSQLYLKGRH